MISIYNLKPKFQQLLRPVLNVLHRLGFTANHITLGSVVLSAGIGICFWFADNNPLFFLALPIGLFLRMALNALDGMMARIFNQQSKLGEILNEIGDVISDLLIYFPLLKFFYSDLYLIVTFLCLSVINEFAGLLAKSINGIRRYDGPMGKSDRALLVGLIGILIFFKVDIFPYSNYIFIIINALMLISTYKRLSGALRNA